MKRKLSLSVDDINLVRSQLGFDTYDVTPSESLEEKKEQVVQNEPKNKKGGFVSKVAKVLGVIKKALKKFYDEVFRFPCYIMSHPVQGWQEFKQEKRGKMSVAVTIILLYVVMRMLEYKYTGPVLNTNNPYKFNSITILVYGIMPPILLSVANWSVTTLMDGKGKMKEIFMMLCYSFFPVMLIGFLNIVVSNYVTKDEAQFILILNIIAWALTAYMALTGLIGIHEYGLGKVLWSVIATVIATAIIAFIALLLFNLAEQIYSFFYSLYDELATRYM
jgi:hypothetical protein